MSAPGELGLTTYLKYAMIPILLLAAACAQHERKTIYVDDVGSNPKFLRNITETLERHELNVVYFTVAGRLDPGTAEILRNRTTGVHGLTHYCGEFDKNYTESKRILGEALEKFREKNITPTHFRPPCDEASEDAKKAAEEAGLTYVKRAPDLLFNCMEDCTKEARLLSAYLKANATTTIHQNQMNAYKLKVLDGVLSGHG